MTTTREVLLKAAERVANGYSYGVGSAIYNTGAPSYWCDKALTHVQLLYSHWEGVRGCAPWWGDLTWTIEGREARVMGLLFAAWSAS